MVISRCKQSGGLIIASRGIILNCGLRVLSCRGKWWSCSPIEVRVLARIMCGPGWVSIKDIVAWVYEDDPDGGPLTAERSIPRHLARIRRKCSRNLGFSAPVRGSRRGYEFCADLIPKPREARAA